MLGSVPPRGGKVATQDALAEIIAEMLRQDAQYGPTVRSRERWLTILSEELGEVARAHLREDRGLAAELKHGSREELVQLAAVALRALRTW